MTVHPRRCGEHTATGAQKEIHCGSSPQVRGTRRIPPLDGARSRFIPAGAGNTVSTITGTTSPFGSSPQVRGTRKFQQCLRLLRRFIPAGAGNTFHCGFMAHKFAVHPRRCGEHLLLGNLICQKDGSSPQVRGTLGEVLQQAIDARFIPAGAGNTERRL